MILVCRTATGYFSQKTEALTLEAAIREKADWIPDQGAFSLEQEQPAPAINWPISLMIMWLNAKIVGIPTGKRST